MLQVKRLNYIWFFVMAITVINAVIAETLEPTLFIVLAIAIAISIKGRMVIDYFMALRHENQRLRAIMNVYFYVIPVAIVVVYQFPQLFT
ncbi:MAG: cytochrome C oxidase subunit IV family protein [Gammaproteobacteria bacterium]|nr:cytochrome C oxidase subunit IV family protein [Gammaproteobacteria bacterium]